MVKPSLTRLVVVLTILGTGLGCELSEVTIPTGDPTVVVHGVMRPDLSQQFIVVERSFTGVVDPARGTGTIPGQAPPTPIEGAIVWVRNLDLPSDPCGSPVVFSGEPQDPLLFTLPGVYWGPPSCPTMRPGDRLELRVETADGEVVTGVTRIPGLDAAWLAVGGDSVELGASDTATFNRDRDTLRIRMETSVGRLMQLEVRLLDYQGEPDKSKFALTKIFVDTTSVLLPGDLLNVFERGEGSEIFRAGRHYTLTAAVTDTNYFDFARSRNNAFTGRGFVNHLTGGIGVFGSLAASSTRVTATGNADDPREGAYRLQGQIQGVDVDAELTVFLARPLEEAEFSAFLDGTWVTRDDMGPGGTTIWRAISVQAGSVDGEFRGDAFSLVVPCDCLIKRFALSGVRVPGSPFPIAVKDSTVVAVRLLGTITATQQ